MLIDKIKKQTRNVAIKAQQFKSDYEDAYTSDNKNVKKARKGVIFVGIGIALVILSIYLSLKS